jgi:hypothetical protein
MKGKPGRPKGQIGCASLEAKAFFQTVDKLGLSLRQLEKLLAGEIESSPKYRTLQEWRRGTHAPRFIRFEKLEAVILNKVSKQEAR